MLKENMNDSLLSSSLAHREPGPECQGYKRDLRIRDRDIWFPVRDETETFSQFHETETRPRR